MSRFTDCIRTTVTALLCLTPLVFSACGAHKTATSNDQVIIDTPANDTEMIKTTFPTDLAVASPFSYEESMNAAPTSVDTDTISSFIPTYTQSVAQINQTLNGTACDFHPELFLATEENADCYGPQLSYENHPDAGAPDNVTHTLPEGDLGLWGELDATSGNACGAAQMNQRLDGLGKKSTASLMVSASLECVRSASALAIPTQGAIDLTDEMNALGIADTVFTQASISHSTALSQETVGQDVYDYDVTFRYQGHDITVQLTYIPGESADSDPAYVYQGKLFYMVDANQSGDHDCPEGAITRNGSLVFKRSSETALSLDMRNGTFCGHGSDGRIDSGEQVGLINPVSSLSEDNPNGWSNSFDIFKADFDPTTLNGDYTSIWQPRREDRYARIMNTHLEDGRSETDETIQVGDIFYGYGESIDESDGNITGFVCNWAGPGATGELDASRIQSQATERYPESNFFTVNDSHVTYAITNDCQYDGSGSFSFDSNGDGVPDSDPSAAIADDLLSVVDRDANGVFDEIEASGFSLPATPYSAF